MIRTALLGAALVAAVLGAAACGPGEPHAKSAGSTTAEATAQPFDFAKLPADVAVWYTYIAANRAQAERIPCYCGCGLTAGHENLRDCFLTAAGEWDAHAAGCGVCLDEAKDLKQLLDQGSDIASARAVIDATYGKLGPGTKTK